ncbi:hypothetical protein G4B88_021801 [Cannabis sativa]|uniref:non-specific serine/threonine protein kinase n=1 Tax=Cannabis sativa TaxID=3483 RepID=A0A7J6F2N8_CANSA|nr:hypothetical protein G4B88_021801 [Cannabis sativa]
MSNYDLSCSEQVPGVNTAADCEKAWHILAILLSIGRPASLGELSSKCELFDATPDYIGSLCSNPNSPIILLDNQLVTVSMAVVSSMVEFASKSKSGGGGGSVSLFGIEFNESNKHLNFDVKTYFRKRKEKEFDPVVFSAAKRRLLYQGENDQLMLSLPTEIKEICNKDKATVPLLLGSNCEFSKNSMMNGNQGKDEGSVGTNILDEGSAGTNIFNHSSAGTNNRDEGSAGTNVLEEQQECSGYVHTSTLPCSLVNKESNLGVLEPIQEDQIMAHNYIETLPLPDNFHDSLSIKKADVDEAVGSKNGVCRSLTFDGEEDKIGNGLPLEGGFSNAHSCRSLIHHIEDVAENIAGTSGNKGVIDHHEEKGDTEKTVRFKELKNLVSISAMDKERTHRLETHTNIRVSGNSSSQKQPVKSYIKLKRMSKNLPPQQGVLLGPSKYSRLIISRKSDQKRHSGEHNSKNSNNGKENAVNPTSMSLKNNLEKKEFPQFDNFLIEDEEGSGPHGKAQKHHVTNELKMLERFGGKNFIIKYEGSLKSGDAECFILEHVDHDRPELQWYGYCMFRALACLHKQGVVHRDIKPGNFLFSRKLNKGYLIDFNLSMDLQQRLSVGSKPKPSSYASFVHAPLSSPVAAQSTKDNKAVRVDRFAVNQGGTVDLKPSHEHKNSVKRKALTDLSNFNKLKSQGADGSAGVTLLYLMMGRSPFTGDPEQLKIPGLVQMWLILSCLNIVYFLSLTLDHNHGRNMKDIAKLKGSEDLWEVAKLHDRESSFPSELLEVQFLDSMEIRSWCRAYTRRPDFFETIPTSLFDLVDKCLTVNPRLRITAEEALRHEFFASCHESLRKVRLQSSMSVCPALNI